MYDFSLSLFFLRDAALTRLNGNTSMGSRPIRAVVYHAVVRRQSNDNSAENSADDNDGDADDDSGGDAARANKRPRTDVAQQHPTDTAAAIARVLQPWHDVPYAEQLARKDAQLRVDLREMTDAALKQSAQSRAPLPRWLARKTNRMLPCALRGVLPTHDEFVPAYRNKCTFTIGVDAAGERVVGNIVSGLASGSELRVARPSSAACGVPRAVEAVRAELEAIVATSTLELHHQTNHTGFWRGCLVRSLSTGVVMLVVWACRAGLTERVVQAEIERLRARCFDASLPPVPWQSLSVQFHEAINNVVPADAPIQHIFGPQIAYEELLGMRFRISAQSFFQVNYDATVTLYSLVRDMVGAFSVDGGSDTVVLDVCCGTGTIGLLLAKQVRRVVGIEMVPEAIDDARHNAQINNVTNATFFVGKVEDVVKATNFDAMVQGAKQVIAVLDPARGGMHPTVLRALRSCAAISHIIYVSCNPKSLVRDAPFLWQPETHSMRGRPFFAVEAVGVDLFPNTEHCELVVSMQRCGTDEQEAARLAAEDQAAAEERAKKQQARDALAAANAANANN
jgi:tRNA (uracil-5-)-methyltransferase